MSDNIDRAIRSLDEAMLILKSIINEWPEEPAKPKRPCLTVSKLPAFRAAMDEHLDG
jgi:hypothetical protein